MTREEITALAGQTIKWSAPSFEENKPYGGIAQILRVSFDNYDETYKVYRNIIIARTIEGDDLNYAFAEVYGESLELCYSDGGRFITYKSI